MSLKLQISNHEATPFPMKPPSIVMKRLASRLQGRLYELGLSKAELARQSGVHPSQVGRVLSGHGQRLSQNVLQICNVLGIDPNVDAADDRARISEAALSIWDGSHEGANAIVGMLRQLARIKERRD